MIKFRLTENLAGVAISGDLFVVMFFDKESVQSKSH